MNAALALEDPVLVIEHVDLYGRLDEIPDGDLDYQLPFGKAALRREGRTRRSSATSRWCTTASRRSIRLGWMPMSST